MKYYFKALKILISKLNRYSFFSSSLGEKIISSLVRPKFDKKEMKLNEKSIFPTLYISRTKRLYYYTNGIKERIENLLDEYLVKDYDFNFEPDDYLIDIGSNIGEFTLGFINKNKIKNLIAIEPDPTEFVVLKKTYKQ